MNVMDDIQIKQVTGEHFRRLKKYLKRIIRDPDTESIHEFRVEYKKLRAFLRMLLHDKKQRRSAKALKKLKKIYRVSGAIRDLQLQRQRVLAAMNYKVKKPQGYGILLRKKIKKLKVVLDDIAGKDPVTESKIKMDLLLPGHFKFQHLKTFTADVALQLTALVSPGYFTDATLHLIRKNGKDFVYNMRLYNSQHHVSLAGNALFLRQEELNSLLDELGNYHDRVKSIILLKPARLNKLDDESKRILENIRQEWIIDKLKRKGVLINHIRSLFTKEKTSLQPPGIFIKDTPSII